jgi:hypothetical protein
MGKYNPANLLPALRLFIEARNNALKTGFTDNGGAIHSVERIVDMLSVRLCYPHLSHINNLKNDPNAEISLKAHEARDRGEPLRIEHVLPQRAYAQEIIRIVDEGGTDAEVMDYIQKNYRLVLLTEEETKLLNRRNRSKITADRIADAGIQLRRSQPV